MSANTLITAEEIARHFGVTVPTVNRWVRKGLIPCVRASRKVVRFVLADVEATLSLQCAEQAATATVENRTEKEATGVT